MARTIFKLLKNLESDVEGSTSDERGKEVLKKLVSFVESGIYTTSVREKFIAKNFRLTASQIAERSNGLHGSHKRKSDNTIRSQMSRLSSSICSLLGYEVEALSEGFSTNDEQMFSRIEAVIDAFAVEDRNVVDRFSFNLQEFLPIEGASAEYSIADCKKEMEFLRAIDKSALSAMLKDLDLSKLAFILEELRKPLFERINSNSVLNEGKLAFAQEFYHVVPKKLKADKVVVEKEIGVAPEAAGVPAKKHEQNLYSLDITPEMAALITRRLADKHTDNTESTLNGVLNVKKLLSTFCTLQGFEKALRDTNRLDLESAINAIKEGVD